MKHCSDGTNLAIEGSQPIMYYLDNVDNSLFEYQRDKYYYRYYLRTIDRTRCEHCWTDDRDIIHSWSISGYAHDDSLHHTSGCVKCIEVGDCNWRAIDVRCVYAHGHRSIYLMTSLTLRAMMFNIASTPSGKFCVSCRIVYTNTKYFGASVCTGCDDHLRCWLCKWQLLSMIYEWFRVPREVTRYTYQLIL